MNSSKDKIKGTVNKAMGKAKQMAGVATDDMSLQSKGATQSALGKAQKFAGDVKDGIKRGIHKLGDKIEHSAD